MIEKIFVPDSNKKIIAVSAGKYFSKKTDDAVSKKILYLNYGLLGLATMLHDHGYDISMFQSFGNCDEIICDIVSCGIDIKDCQCILLSIPSNFSVSWSSEFCGKVKQIANIPIIVGGRWVVDGNTEWIKEKLKYADIVLEGFGERKIAQLFDFSDKEAIVDGCLKCFDKLDYKLLHDYQMIQPIIEISRGCGSGCTFCADRMHRRTKNKEVSKILNEFEKLDELYGDTYKVYFEAPHFVFEKEWAEAYNKGVKQRKRIVPWRCTSRVESIPTTDKELSMLSESGLKLIDIGLESASSRQLLSMHKTRHPTEFLSKADKILRQCFKHGIWIKLNILLYAGETYETLNETTEWLLERKEYIKGISCASLVYYQNSNNINEFIKLGASVPDMEYFRRNGFTLMDLSPDIDHQTALKICKDMPRSIMTPRDYYDIKEHSYFKIGYSYEDFLKDLNIYDLKNF